MLNALRALPFAKLAVALKVAAGLGGALAYGISPIDLIPDLIPLVGLLDDGLVMALVVVVGVAAFRKARREAPRRTNRRRAIRAVA